jgi:hypothetical protein
MILVGLIGTAISFVFQGPDPDFTPYEHNLGVALTFQAVLGFASSMMYRSYYLQIHSRNASPEQLSFRSLSWLGGPSRKYGISIVLEVINVDSIPPYPQVSCLGH